MIIETVVASFTVAIISITWMSLRFAEKINPPSVMNEKDKKWVRELASRKLAESIEFPIRSKEATQRLIQAYPGAFNKDDLRLLQDWIASTNIPPNEKQGDVYRINDGVYSCFEQAEKALSLHLEKMNAKIVNDR